MLWLLTIASALLAVFAVWRSLRDRPRVRWKILLLGSSIVTIACIAVATMQRRDACLKDDRPFLDCLGINPVADIERWRPPWARPDRD